MVCSDSWNSVLTERIYRVPSYLVWWAGSGRYWWPLGVAFLFVLLGVLIALFNSRNVVMSDQSRTVIAMTKLPSILAHAFWRYRLVVLALGLVGSAILGMFLRRYASPCQLFADMGVAGPLWRLSPNGIDQVIGSLNMILVIMLMWCGVSAITAFLIAYDPFGYPVFYLKPKSQPVGFFAIGNDKPEIWAKGKWKPITRPRVYFSSDGTLCSPIRRRNQPGGWICLELSPNRDEDTASYVLLGDVEEQSQPPHFARDGVPNQVAPGSFKIGDKEIEYVFRDRLKKREM